MRTPEQIITDGERAASTVWAGESWLRLAAKYKGHRGRKYHDKGCKLIAQGEARMKALQSEAGRLRKKLKTRKKYTKLVTLTEVHGIPWRVLVKK